MAESDDAPKRPLTHVIGEALDDLSIRDFDERIAALQAEIERLDRAKHKKQAAMDQAASMFRW